MRLVLLVLIVVGVAGPAWGQAGEHDRKLCLDDDDIIMSIIACSSIIDSGQVSTDGLAEALRYRGLGYLEVEELDSAVADFSRYLEMKPENASVWSMLCLTLVGTRRFSAAEEDCNRALQLKPDSNDDALDNRGFARLGLGRLPEARADFNAALSVNPKDPFSMFGRGIVKQVQGDAAGGEEDLDAATKLYPGVATFMARYGIVPKKPAGAR